MVGSTFSHYRILEVLGQGGMGVVYKAQDAVLERVVALKVMRPEMLASPELRARFLWEARSAAALSHPNIAHIYEAAEADGTLFIAMEFIAGQSLRARLATPLPLEEALHIARDIASGLAHAHAHQIVHRDLKPENVILGADGRARILDFGLAKGLQVRGSTSGAESIAETQTAVAELTVQGQILGTPRYMSPEQARGHEVDARSDIFSFGTMLYEMVSGEAPFRGDTPLDVLSALLHAQPVTLAARVARLPAGLDAIVSRCLAKDPGLRPASGEELLADLERIGGRPVSWGAALPRWTRGRPGRRLAVVAAALLFAAAGMWLRPWDQLAMVGDRADKRDAVSAAGASPNWILVADFAGTGVSPDILVATRELITASLAQSNAFTPLSRPQVLRGLQLAELPESTRVTGEVAAEIAERAAARLYVEGRIDKLMSGYSIVVNAINRETGARVASVQRSVTDDRGVIRTLDELGRELRQRLGEKRESVRRTEFFREVFTPSLDAYRAFVGALELQNQAKYGLSVARMREALALDPAFASAWLAQGANYYNLGFPDSARAAFDQAFRHRDRLTERQQLVHKWFMAYVVECDLNAALEYSNQLVEKAPTGTSLHNNRGTVLFDLGRYEEAIEAQRLAIKTSPFGGSPMAQGNEQSTLLQLGRYDEARRIDEGLTGPLKDEHELALALSTDRWAQAESLATALQSGQGRPTQRYEGTLALAALAARRGEIARSLGLMEMAWQVAPNPFWADLTRIAWIQLHAMSGIPLDPSRLGASADTTATLYAQALARAVAGDTAGARKRRAAIEHRPIADRRRYETDLRILDGWIAARASQWEAVRVVLEPLCESGRGPWISGRIPIRWLVASAAERLGTTAGTAGSSSEAWKRVLSPLRLHQDVVTWRAAALPFAHQRLALAAAREGRSEDARRELAALEACWTTPDATARALLEDVHRALSKVPQL